MKLIVKSVAFTIILTISSIVYIPNDISPPPALLSSWSEWSDDNIDRYNSMASAPIFLPIIFNQKAEISAGYNLFTPINNSTKTYLANNNGDIIFYWRSKYPPAMSVYLLENGNILRPGYVGKEVFGTNGKGGIVEEIRPDGRVVWDFEYVNNVVLAHHDIEPLPNGNILMIAWEMKTSSQAVLAGRNPDTVGPQGLWSDHIIEVQPDNRSIVWEWHVWDHLVQEYDPMKDNYGIVAENPGLINLNHNRVSPDWNHTNSIDYNPILDQILISVPVFGEIWVIDHSTTTQQAAGHSGGNSGKGGDLLYRWGNPQKYGAGIAIDQKLFDQHDANWIPPGYPGAGHILVFNNGRKCSDGRYSSVDEIIPPIDDNGIYSHTTGTAYGPEAPIWSYSATPPTSFYASVLSGAQRLPNGNTLICNGLTGYTFEVTPWKQIVWSQNFNATVFWVKRYKSDFPGLLDIGY